VTVLKGKSVVRQSICIVLALALAVVIRPVHARGAGKGEVVNRWAILIGVDDYAELSKLRFAGNDQRALAEQLIAIGFPKDQVFLLDDKAAEKKYLPFRENIEKQLDLVMRLAADGDLVIVGFSGHGVQLEGKSYLCPEDTRLDKLAATMIPVESVYQRLARCSASLKLLLVDACRNDVIPAGRKSVTLSRSLGEFVATTEKPPEGTMLLTSCGPGQVSLEDEEFNHSVFVNYLLEGLRGQAVENDGTISLAGLYNFASLQTKKYVARKFNEYQTPALKGDINGPFEIAARAKTITNGIGMKLALIPAGESLIGSRESSEELAKAFAANGAKPEDFTSERPAHYVRLVKPFYLGSHEVTVGQFRKFVEDTGYKTDAEKDGEGGYGTNSEGNLEQKPDYTWRNPGFPQTVDHPVGNVSWNDAVSFCEWLSRKEGKTYRLPTEAEWEYACRAGSIGHFGFSAPDGSLGEYGWYADNSEKKTHPVGQKKPSAWGLYDMHGNVMEWCRACDLLTPFLANALEGPLDEDLKIALTLTSVMSDAEKKARGFDVSELRLVDADGKSVDWSKSAGKVKVLFLEFPHGSCPTCKTSSVVYKYLLSKYASKGVRFDLVNINPDQPISGFFPGHTELFAPLIDADSFFMKKLNISYCPVVLVVGRDNRVLFMHAGANRCMKQTTDVMISAVLGGRRFPEYADAAITANRYLRESGVLQIDPQDRSFADAVCVRGGSFGNDPAYCRSAETNGGPPTFRHCVLGFRVCLVVADK
jgi:formylglycine-generating enzyme required for sulfatase activity